MSNDEILKKNGGKKFITIMNPPYGGRGADLIHYDFTKKCLEISNNSIIIMPCSILRRKSPGFNKYINIFDKYLISAEEADSNIFTDTNMQEVAIYKFGNKNNNQKIIINHTYGEEIVDSLNNISGKINNDNITEEILNYLYNNKPYFKIYSPRSSENFDEKINKILTSLNDEYYLITNIDNGSSKGPRNPNFISSILGQILNNKNELKEFLYNRGYKGCNIISYNSFEGINNLKNSLKNNLLRFTLLRVQNNQHLNKLQYSYIPNIDWSKVNSDEDILRFCGCPENKIKEYIEYVNNIMKDYPLK